MDRAVLPIISAHTNALLGTSGHPSIEVLLTRSAEEQDHALLSGWTLILPSNLPAQLTSFTGREEDVERPGTRCDTPDWADDERTPGTLRIQLDERREVFLDEGSAMSREKAVEYAAVKRCTAG